MANLNKVFSDEIRRLARRELRGEIATIRKAGAQYRRDIAELKRQIKDLERRLKVAERAQGKAVRAGTRAPSNMGTEAAGLRFSAKGLKKHRDRLGLSATDMATLLDVSPLSVYNWEHGKTRPSKSKLAKIAEVRQLGKREALRKLEEAG